MSMKRDGEIVNISISAADYEFLQYALGTVGGIARRNEQPELANSTLRLVNTICEGDPDYMPYEVPAPEADAETPAAAQPAACG